MATKHTDTCLIKAADDEPIFVLRAQDASADQVIGYWIERNPQLPLEKKQEAAALAEKMRAWPKRKLAD